MAAVYFVDTFGVGVAAGGALAGLHGATNLFARALGGWCGDRVGARLGLGGRTALLAGLLLAEGALLIVFSQSRSLATSGRRGRHCSDAGAHDDSASSPPASV